MSKLCTIIIVFKINTRLGLSTIDNHASGVCVRKEKMHLCMPLSMLILG